MRRPLTFVATVLLPGFMALGLLAPLSGQGGSSWYRPTSNDPWGGSIQPWTGQTGATIGSPYNRRDSYSGRRGGRVGSQQNTNPLWGWIGIGQPKAYGTYLPPYPDNRQGGQARGAWPGQANGSGAQSGVPGVPTQLYGKDAYKGSLLPGAPKSRKTTEKPGIPGIPKWLNQPGRGRRVLGKKDLGYGRDPARCFLLRMQDRVEVRPAEEAAFYPLAYWDKSRVLAPGAGMRIVAGGRALLVFPAGTQLDLARPAEVWFKKGTQDRLELDCRDVNTANVTFGMREVRMILPEGSRIRGRSLSFSITRERRPQPWMPGRTEDYLVLRNWGPAAIYLDSDLPGATTVTILANRRVVLPIPVTRPGAPVREHQDDPPLDLSMEGGGTPLQASVQADIQMEGKSLRVQSRTGKARLQWGGFAARLQPGWHLRIDPIGGSPFGEGRAVPHQRIPTKEPKK